MPLAADAVGALAAKGLTLATAEATTGGLIGHLLTEIPGSSRVFRGGVAPYANALKQAIGVPASLLAEHGAVSREAAEALARAVREWAGADIGLAETGIAGPVLRLSAAADAQDERPRPPSPPPSGPDRPAGLFWIALADAGGVRSERFVFDGDRSENRRACAEAALRMLLDRLSAT
jgi:nicotinamide mononucleotide (NMN) deamidase PncC